MKRNTWEQWRNKSRGRQLEIDDDSKPIQSARHEKVKFIEFEWVSRDITPSGHVMAFLRVWRNGERVTILMPILPNEKFTELLCVRIGRKPLPRKVGHGSYFVAYRVDTKKLPSLHL